MKILISIPNTKKSERFPGKNKLLANKTIQWLNEEVAFTNLPDDWDIKIVEIISPWTEETITPFEKFNSGYEDDHQKSLEALQKEYQADIHVHLQVTNYDRRMGLLKDSINALLFTDADVISSYKSYRDNYSWRKLIKKDNGYMFSPEIKIDEINSYYEGSIYVARDLSKLWDYNAQWDFVWNGVGPVVDIDYEYEYK